MAAGQAAQAQPRVILISCDGLRPDAIAQADAPVLQGLIAGGMYEATALDEIPPVTLPNHASMVTGLSVAHHGVLVNTDLPGRIASTTIFDVAKAAGLRVGFFAGKTKLGYLCPEGSVDAWRMEGDLDVLMDAVVACIESDDLQLVFVHLGPPDAAGHNYGWMSPEYLAAVATTDAAIGRITDALDRTGRAASTTVLVAADHGGHANTHGSDIPEDRDIPFILHGPGIPAGRGVTEQVHIMDLAATTLHLLGLSTDSASDGRVITETDASGDASSPIPPVSFTGLCAPLPFFMVAAPLLLWRSRGSLRRTYDGGHGTHGGD